MTIVPYKLILCNYLFIGHYSTVADLGITNGGFQDFLREVCGEK